MRSLPAQLSFPEPEPLVCTSEIQISCDSYSNILKRKKYLVLQVGGGNDRTFSETNLCLQIVVYASVEELKLVTEKMFTVRALSVISFSISVVNV